MTSFSKLFWPAPKSPKNPTPISRVGFFYLAI